MVPLSLDSGDSKGKFEILLFFNFQFYFQICHADAIIFTSAMVRIREALAIMGNIRIKGKHFCLFHTENIVGFQIKIFLILLIIINRSHMGMNGQSGQGWGQQQGAQQKSGQSWGQQQGAQQKSGSGQSWGQQQGAQQKSGQGWGQQQGAQQKSGQWGSSSNQQNGGECTLIHIIFN